MTGLYVKRAVNTLNASWLELKMAKLFGKKSVHHEDNVMVKLSKWRGKTYLIDVTRNNE